MGRASIKSNDPIPLPHDGPLHQRLHVLRKAGTTGVEDGAAAVDDVSLNWNNRVTTVALDILQENSNTTRAEENNNNSECQRILQLLQTLQTAPKIKDQLQALQLFRSATTNPKKASIPSNEDSVTTSLPKLCLFRSALYRILLEWFLSYKTPLPLRRAIQGNLEGLQQQIITVKEGTTTKQSSFQTCLELRMEVLQSFLVVQEVSTLSSSLPWEQPLHSLHEALNYASTHDTLLLLNNNNNNDTTNNNPSIPVREDNRPMQVLHFLQGYAESNLRPILFSNDAADQPSGKRVVGTVMFVEQEVTDAMQRAIQWATILKTVLADAPSLAIINGATSTGQNSFQQQQQPNTNNDNLFQFFQDFVWNIMLSQMTLTDSLSKLGMAHSRVLLLQKPPSTESSATNTCLSTHIPELVAQQLPALVTIALVQGLAATVPIQIMLVESDVLLHYFQQQSLEADPGVRLAALKGIHTLISRCLTRALRCSNSKISKEERQALSLLEIEEMQTLTQQTLEIVLQAWESPPNRRLGSAIPSLFEKLVSLMQELGRQHQDDSDSKDTGQQQVAFQDLVKRLLAQPSNRKGRYKALETLLPIVGARNMIALGREWKLMESLLEGIGDRNSHSAGAIADLWQKILTDLLQDMLANTEAVISDPLVATSDGENKKKRRKAEYPIAIVQQVVPVWCNDWVPSLAEALLSSAKSRRKHVAQFCLPRIASMLGGRKKQDENAMTFALLLQAIHLSESEQNGGVNLGEVDGLSDRVLWATLETIKHSNVEKIGNITPILKDLLETIARLMPLQKLRAALKHFLPTVRLVAFQTIRPLVLTYAFRQHGGQSALVTLDDEICLWKEAFPYAIKTEGIEYRTSLLECLTLSIDRISSEESTALETSTSGITESYTVVSLPRLHSFVVDFLIFDVVVQQAAYPASVAEKEAFAIELLEAIIAFASRDIHFVTKNVAYYDRRRRRSESKAATKMLEALLSREPISTLMSLMSSVWDGTRSASFCLLSRLVVVGHTNKLQISENYTSSEARIGMEARGVYLASSPRQREADTGARILAFLYFTLPTGTTDRRLYLAKLVSLLKSRLGSMKERLAALLSGSIDPHVTGGGLTLPLAHGLIHALRLIVQHIKMEFKHSKTQYLADYHEICEDMAGTFCQAIQVSLTIVADVKDGEVIDGMDEDLVSSDTGSSQQSSTPLNVNTGAIGANGTFSSVNTSKEEEQGKRIAIQRVVMGSWLLTRETCAALSALLTSSIFPISATIMDRAGMLLISTLVSLKHVGAAFAAHRALQQISLFCFNSTDPALGSLPLSWANRLLGEITEAEKVRDSTLRRSTGYGLGFLAIMRSEVSSGSDSRNICVFILSKIMRLTLPSTVDLQHFFAKLKLSESFLASAFPDLSQQCDGSDPFQERVYQIRSRVHALNVLRLIILDAPLSSEVNPFIGNAIISSVTGYNDEAWAVRNSSTMVFAAAMVRKVDADKNASITDMTGSNAVTVGELFRSYPSLAPFLNAVLVSGDALGWDATSEAMSTPPMFPILLLLSRVQPVANSGPESDEKSQPFIAGVFKSLLDRHYAVRAAAAHTLANLCSGTDGHSVSTLRAMLGGCHRLLVDGVALADWNAVSGSLLGIKALVSQFVASEAYLREFMLVDFFLKISKATSVIWPPMCLSEVLCILSNITAATSINADNCQQIEISCESAISSICKRPTTADGSSELATTTAQVWCHILVPKVWDFSQDDEGALSKLGELLGCNVIDVRLHACKLFKKSIYKSIDYLLAENDSAANIRAARLVAIAWTIVKATHKEMARSKEGIHPPTLRRLSRCLLECISAHNTLKEQSTHLARDLTEEIGGIARSLIEQDHCLDDNIIRRETPLSGNGLELLSFAIAEKHSQQTLGQPFDQSHEEEARFFCLTVCRLNNPDLSWRLRHSAAVSIEHSELLLLGEESSFAIKQIQHNLLEEVLTMLQDQDPDVRCAAGRAIAGMTSALAMNRQQFVSQIVLEQAYQLAYDLPVDNSSAEETQECVAHLLQGIRDHCQGLNNKLLMLRDELKHTNSPVELSEILNVGTDRKIFEDEVANPYEESALACQLAIYSLLRFSPSKLTDNFPATASSIVRKCQEIVSILKTNLEDNHAGDLLHEVSRSATVFVEIHSLVVASAVTIYLGNNGNANIQGLATDILSIPRSHQIIHPLVLAAMVALASAEPGSSATRTSILQCLFLLPTRLLGNNSGQWMLTVP